MMEEYTDRELEELFGPEPQGSIDCRLMSFCRIREKCVKVGTGVSGILPIAKSIFANFGLDWRLPGQGVAYTSKVQGSNCGDWRSRGCLHSELHTIKTDLLGVDIAGRVAIQWYHRSCGRAECPICYEKWASLEARKIEHRINHFLRHGKVLHVVISPTEHDVLSLPFEKLRAKMYSVARNRGIRGGVSIFHPWRENDDGTWRVSPHFHLLCFGWIKNTVEGYEKDGWLVINILDGKKERSTYYTAYYQLSHCGLSKEFHTVTWFGKLGYSQRAVKVSKFEVEKEKCLACGHELVEVRFMGLEGELPDREEGKVFWLPGDNWIECVTPAWRG